MSKAKSGGGATMNKNVRPPIKVGPPSTRVVSPAGAANLGISKGNHASDGGRTMQRPPQPLVTGTMKQVPLGNDLARNVGRGGPGKGYVNHGQSGSQSQHGPTNPGGPSLTPTPGGGPGGFGFTGKKGS